MLLNITESAEHEKIMNEYKGGPIKIEYKKYKEPIGSF